MVTTRSAAYKVAKITKKKMGGNRKQPRNAGNGIGPRRGPGPSAPRAVPSSSSTPRKSPKSHGIPDKCLAEYAKKIKGRGEGNKGPHFLRSSQRKNLKGQNKNTPPGKPTAEDAKRLIENSKRLMITLIAISPAILQKHLRPQN